MLLFLIGFKRIPIIILVYTQVTFVTTTMLNQFVVKNIKKLALLAILLREQTENAILIL